MNREEIVVLNFRVVNNGDRIHENNDFNTDKLIPADEICVVTGHGKVPIMDYYLVHKERLDKLNIDNVTRKLENVLLRLRKIPSTDKQYTINDCLVALDLLAGISILDKKDSIKLRDSLVEIKEATLKLLQLNGINENIKNYRIIGLVFDKIISGKENVSI